MTTKPENQFISSVHAHLPPPSKLYRMKNNNEFIAGVADCWYSGKLRDLWIEWKFLVLPVRDSTVIDMMAGKKPIISALQQEWLRERHKEGRHVWVGVGSAKGGVIFPDLEWEEAFTADEFRRLMSDRKTLAGQIADFVQGTA